MDRYWVGTGQSWAATSPTRWSATDGGPAGASIPLATDNVFFTANSGNIAMTTTGTLNCLNIDFTGYTGTASSSSTTALSIYGSMILSPTMTYSFVNPLIFRGVGNHVITSNGIGINNAVSFSGTGTYTFTDNFSTVSLTAGVFRPLTLNSGSIIFSPNTTITIGSLASSNTAVRSINLNNATINILGNTTSWNLSIATNLTFSQNNSTLNFTNNTSNTLALQLGGQTYNRITVDRGTIGGTGTNIVISSGTIDYFKMRNTGASVKITAGFSGTVNIRNFDVVGNNPTGAITLGVGSFNNTTLSGAGYYLCDNLVIDNVSTGPNTICAGPNSVTLGNPVTGWKFACSNSSEFSALGIS